MEQGGRWVSGISLSVEGCLGCSPWVGREQQGRGALLGLSQPEKTHPGGQPPRQRDLRKGMCGTSWSMNGKGVRKRLLRMCIGSSWRSSKIFQLKNLGWGRGPDTQERTIPVLGPLPSHFSIPVPQRGEVERRQEGCTRPPALQVPEPSVARPGQ